MQKDSKQNPHEVKSELRDWLSTGTFSAILSILSAISVAIIGWWSSKEIETIRASLKQQEIELAKQQFEDEITMRWEDNLKEYIPKIVSGEASDRSSAKAVIFALYPNDAVNVIKSIEAATSDSASKQEIKTIRLEAEELNSEVGEWLIVISADKNLTHAKHEVERAKEVGYKQVDIYCKNDYYRTIIGSFGSREDAQLELISIKHQLNKSAYVINQKIWCDGPESGEDCLVCP